MSSAARKASTRSAKISSSGKSSVTTTPAVAASAASSAATKILFQKTHAQYGCFSNFSLHPITMVMPAGVLKTVAAEGSLAAATAVPYVAPANPYAAFASTAAAASSSNANNVLMTFPTSEHYFQAIKFPLGSEAFYICVDAPTPALTKRAGGNRSVPIRGDWNTYRHNVMVNVLRVKFGVIQNPNAAADALPATTEVSTTSSAATNHWTDASLKAILLSTGDAEIVEHSVWDKYWGDGGNGRGQNHLGKTLMQVRDELRRGYKIGPYIPDASLVLGDGGEGGSVDADDTEEVVANAIAANAMPPKKASGTASKKEEAVDVDVSDTDAIDGTAKAKVPRPKKNRLQ